jgi:hypothetical protein
MSTHFFFGVVDAMNQFSFLYGDKRAMLKELMANASMFNVSAGGRNHYLEWMR